MTAERTIFEGGAKAIRFSLVLFAVGITTLAIGTFVDRKQALVSYLIACAFAVSIATGALIFLMICHAMRAKWPTAVRRLLEANIAALPILAVLFIPICLDLDALYPWRHPELFHDAEERALIVHKQPYLNAPFFVLRTAAFFAIWIVVSELLRRWSLRQDEGQAIGIESKLHRLSAAALPAVALAMSFAAFDWLMSLAPLWQSTMYPVYFFAGGFLAAIALLSVSTYLAKTNGLLPDISRSHYYALGRLLFAFTIFWAYAGFFQYLIMWIADRPDEVSFYALRQRAPWDIITIVLVGGRFVVPFCLLLGYRFKQDGRRIAGVGMWMLLMHYFDVHWLVAPLARSDRFPFHWLDVSALLTVGSLSVSAGLLSLRGHYLVPIHDSRLPEALRYESS